MIDRFLIIRVDSNPVIASGHLMRCIALAEEAENNGFDVTFFMADDNSKYILDSYDFKLVNLNSDWKNLHNEIPTVKLLLKKYNNPIYLIDTYSVDSTYVNSLNPLAHIVYLGSKEKYLGRLSMLINYSANINKEIYQNQYPDTKLLLGVEYAPLRKEFSNIKRRSVDNKLHVLLTTGNTDHQNYIGQIFSTISPLSYKNVTFDIVIGNMFMHKNALIDKFSLSPNVRLHENISRISELMEISSLAISAAGTTTYELVAAKVPSIVFSMVPEQVAGAEGMHTLGLIEYCGEIYKNRMCLDKIKQQFCKYIESEDLRIRLAESAFSKIDGRGCQKIITEINKLN